MLDTLSLTHQRPVAQWLVRCAGDPVEASTVGSTPGRGRVKDHFSVVQNQHLSSLVSACLAFLRIRRTKIAYQRLCSLVTAYYAFLRTRRTKIAAHVKNPMSTFGYPVVGYCGRTNERPIS